MKAGTREFPLLHIAPDSELFALFVSGNDDAYTALYNRYNSRLLNYTYSLLGEHNKGSDDIFQEAFLRLFRERERVREGVVQPLDNVGGWLFRVARNLSLNYIRSARYLTHTTPIYNEQLITSVEEAHTDLFGGGNEEEFLLHAVHGIVETLPASLREVFILREVNGMSYEETAEIIGCTTEAARMRLSRARTAIRKALQPLLAEMGR